MTTIGGKLSIVPLAYGVPHLAYCGLCPFPIRHTALPCPCLNVMLGSHAWQYSEPWALDAKDWHRDSCPTFLYPATSCAQSIIQPWTLDGRMGSRPWHMHRFCHARASHKMFSVILPATTEHNLALVQVYLQGFISLWNLFIKQYIIKKFLSTSTEQQ